MTGDPVARTAGIGKGLMAAGYRPVALATGQKCPTAAGWPDIARAGQYTADPAHLNIGILCDGLRVIDADIDEPGLAEQVKALAKTMLGTAPTRFRVNSSRWAMLYSAAEGEPPKRKIGGGDGCPAVEVLGRGQQIFAVGLHPSGVPLQWQGFVSCDKLPVITEKQITEFLAAAAHIIGAPPENSSVHSVVVTSHHADLRAVDTEILASIVREIKNDARFDDRGNWIAMAHAIAAAFQNDLNLGEKLWLEFCAQRPQNQNEPEEVWRSIGSDHTVGAEYLLAKSAEAGVDTHAYRLVVAQAEFQSIGPMPPALIESRLRAAAVAWPAGFSMNSRSLSFSEPGGDGPSIDICAPFEVIAETRDESSESWGLHLCWHDADGKPHEWAMPRALVHQDGGAIAAQLESLGLQCIPGRTAQGLLKRALGGVRVAARRTCVARPGWHGSTFVLPDGTVFGAQAEMVVLQSESAISGEAYGESGDLPDWQGTIGKYAVGNSRLALFISAALAGALLDIATEPSGGVHLVGKSQSGKSTAAFAAGSVWGRGDRGAQVRSWRATSNGLEGVAAECCDTVLILDELGQADAREVGAIIYGIANESGKARASRSGEARKRKTWRTILLSTGEVSLAAKIATAGQSAMTGQDVRLVTLPADADAGFGLFEKLHDQPSPAALADHLRAAARKHYGTAGRAFVAKLAKLRTQDDAAFRLALLRARERFLLAHVPPGSDGQVSSVCSRFALIAAAGELATGTGILPWPKGEATSAAATCFNAYLDDRGSTGAGEDERAVAQVRAFLELHGESRFTRLSTDPITKEDSVPGHLRTVSRAGFLQTPAGGLTEYWVLAEAWRNEVCKGLDFKRAAATLLRLGFLRGEGDRTTVRQVIPGVGRIRVYALKSEIFSDEPTAQP